MSKVRVYQFLAYQIESMDSSETNVVDKIFSSYKNQNNQRDSSRQKSQQQAQKTVKSAERILH